MRISDCAKMDISLQRTWGGPCPVRHVQSSIASDTPLSAQ